MNVTFAQNFIGVWQSFLEVIMLSYMIYAPISTITLGFCLFEKCLQILILPS